MQKAITKHKGQMMINKLKTMQFKRAAVKLINVKNALLAGLTLLASNCYADGQVLDGAWSSITSNFGTSSIIFGIAMLAELISCFILHHKTKDWKVWLYLPVAMIATKIGWSVVSSLGG